MALNHIKKFHLNKLGVDLGIQDIRSLSLEMNPAAERCVFTIDDAQGRSIKREATYQDLYALEIFLGNERLRAEAEGRLSHEEETPQQFEERMTFPGKYLDQIPNRLR